jgi:putative nucleotidyltransferase with HDIG domain
VAALAVSPEEALLAQAAQRRRRLALGVSAAGFLGTLVWFALVGHSRLSDPLLPALAVGAIASELTRVQYSSSVYVSASFACSMLAVAFLGPAAAFLLAVVTDLVTWPMQRRPANLVVNNLFSVGLPSLVAATLFASLTSGVGSTDAVFLLALVGVALVANALNFVLASVLGALAAGRDALADLQLPQEYLIAVGLNIALTTAVVGIYARYGPAAAAFLIVALIGFNYMAYLIAQARDRAKAYASLSWGVLSGLMRAVDHRDPRSTRHSAAVAGFSRDIAVRAGMSEGDVELAHTAGLLHDVGKFALSDRVMERGGELGEPDWHAVRKHPELGADMLRDLGLYGPVADIVRAHHERPDGRGYPYGLTSEQIPELAKIVAVAEVYDTLTGEGTYRQRMNSFEALTELRRVSGKQLDGRYVEILAELLAGTDTQYRHRDDADFYRELDLERRIEEAAAR